MKKLVIVLSLAFVLAACASTSDRSLMPQRSLMNAARGTVIKMVDSEEFPQLRSYIQKSRAVLIVPNLYKAGFFIGGEYGTAVLLARTDALPSSSSMPPAAGGVNSTGTITEMPPAAPVPAGPIQSEELKPQSFLWHLENKSAFVTGGGAGAWGNPLFFTVTSASLGIQLGGEAQEAVFTIMTEKGLDALLKSSFKFGADISVAVGPIGKGMEAATGLMPPKADIYVFARSAGLYGGGSLEGSVITEKTSWNMALYGAQTDPRQVLMTSAPNSLEEAEALKRVLP